VEIRPTGDGQLISEQLGLRLEPHGSMLRLYDLRTGLLLPTRREKADAATREAETERRRADELAAEVVRLRRTVNRMRRRNGEQP
jgi:hypothetical protein